MYTFSFIVGNIIPKSAKCIHSATKVFYSLRSKGVRFVELGVQVPGFPEDFATLPFFLGAMPFASPKYDLELQMVASLGV